MECTSHNKMSLKNGSLNVENKQEKRIKTSEEAFLEIGYGRAQIEILIVVSCVLITSLNQNIGISFLIPAAQCDLNLTTADKGLLSGMVSLGIMVSSLFWGFLADTRGRRFTILVALSISTGITLISVFVKSFEIFAACRFLTGIFVSGFSASVYPYVGEFNTAKHRATIVSWLSASTGITAIIQPLLAWWILSYEWSFEVYSGFYFKPWRLLMIVFILQGIVAMFWLFFRLPESPKYFLSRNEKAKALEVMRWMYGVNHGRNFSLHFTVHELVSEKSDETTLNRGIFESLIEQTLPLLRPPHLLHFLTCSVLHFGTFAIGGGMAFFLPDVLNKFAKSEIDNRTLTICESMTDQTPSMDVHRPTCDDSVDTSVFINSALIGVAYTLGFVLISLAMQPFGRRIIFGLTLLASSLSGIYLPMTSSKYLILILCCLFIVLAGINVSTINSAACDLFPTHLRAMAVCVTMLFGRLGSVSSVNFIAAMIDKNCEITFYLHAGLMFICFLVSFIVPDSRRDNNKLT